MFPPTDLVAKDDFSSKRKTQLMPFGEEFNQAIIDTIGAMVIVTDPKGVVQLFNKAAENISGYKANEIVGKVGFDVLIPRDVRPKIVELLKIQKSTPLPRRGEGTLLTKGGDVRVISWIDNGIYNTNGDLEYLIFTGTDFTYRKEIEQQLVESVDNLELDVAEKTLKMIIQQRQIGDILNSLNNGIIIIDKKGNFVNVNNSFRNLYRKSLDEDFPTGSVNLSSLKVDHPLLDMVKDILQSPLEQSRTIEIKPDLFLTLSCNGQFIKVQQGIPIKVMTLFSHRGGSAFPPL